MEDNLETQITGIAALSDPTRRALYRFVVSQPGPVGRDQAAEGVGVPRHVAKFHLDKLLDDGVLAVEFARTPGRRGPGAGRPAKLYSRSSRELAVSLPQRDYELAGRLLATAVVEAASGGIAIEEALDQVSRIAGRALGQKAHDVAGTSPTPGALIAAASAVLVDCGYEPRATDAAVVLVNCPFHALAQDFTDLVCGMNLALLSGFLDTLQHPTLDAHLAPAPGHCCVRLSEQPTSHHPVADKEE